MIGLRIAVIVAVLSAALAAREYGDKREALAQLAMAQEQADNLARAKVADTLDRQIGEIARTIEWLDAYYRSDAGLQRREGLWIDGHPDSAAIATWVVDVYVANRLRGRTEAEARGLIEDSIRRSDEWRAKHPAAASR